MALLSPLALVVDSGSGSGSGEELNELQCSFSNFNATVDGFLATTGFVLSKKRDSSFPFMRGRAHNFHEQIIEKAPPSPSCECGDEIQKGGENKIFCTKIFPRFHFYVDEGRQSQTSFSLVI